MRSLAKRGSSAVRRLRFERLEDRAMLAGNVSTAFDNTVGGALVLTGDNSANHLVIHQVAPNSFQVLGVGTNVNVNGQNFNSFTFKNVTDVTIDLMGGNDSLVMYNMTVNGTLTIDMGAGNDVLSVVNVRENVATESAGLATITLGSGNDVATIVNFSSSADIAIDAGEGRDVVALNHVVAGTVGSGNTLSVEMGPGDFDSLAIAFCSADTGSFSDTGGSNGIIVGVLNHFGNAGSTVTPGDFRFHIGIS
jgi:hypothetical protein